MTDTTTATPAQINPDAAPQPSATPSADAGAAPPAASPATAPAPAADGSTVLGGGTPVPAASGATPPADGAAPVDYAAMVDALALPDGVPDTLAPSDDDKSFLRGLAEKATLNADQLKVVHDAMIEVRHADRQQLEQQVQAWNQQLMSDPELVGADGKQWETTKANIERVFSIGDTTALREFFHVTGLGNHPLFVKHYAAIGALLSPDATRAAQDTAPATPQRAADVLYKDL